MQGSDVSIIGVGQTPVGEHWERSLSDLAAAAARQARDDAGDVAVQALYVGNMAAGQLSGQEHLGALLADVLGLRGIEAFRAEAADASGAAALRQGYLAVASGAFETVMVIGVEKPTDVTGGLRAGVMASALDAEHEALHGATPVAMAALLMQRYLHETGAQVADFAGFSVNAHRNAAGNPNAMYRNAIKPEVFAAAPPVATPVGLFDAAPDGDGAAALILTVTDLARDRVPQPVRIAASAVATDTLALQDRADLLALSAARRSVEKAYRQAGITPDQVDVFELHDSFTILAALSLEAAGFAGRGEGYKLAADYLAGVRARPALATFGGLKARGHAGGATGIYQVAEVALQLRDEAGENQVAGARIGMAQNLGGVGGTAITHIMEAVR